MDRPTRTITWTGSDPANWDFGEPRPDDPVWPERFHMPKTPPEPEKPAPGIIMVREGFE